MARLLLLSCIVLVGCGTTDPDEKVSITQGVYGSTIAGCDTSNCEDEVADDVLVYAKAPGGTVVAMTRSDDDGFFEIALEPGSYDLCVYNCRQITIGEGELLERTFISGPGGGIWCDETGCRP
jgi:hypothetical protein